MTPHQTLVVAVRLFAIWLALYTVQDLIGLYVNGRQQGDTGVGWLSLSLAVLAIMVVALLWFFPRTIARGLLPSPPDIPQMEPAAPDIWFGVGAALIGLWLVASAVPGLLYNLLTLYLFRSEMGDRNILLPQIGYLLQIGVGGAVMLGMNAFKRFFRWARYAGPD